VEVDRRREVEVQTTLSVSPGSVHAPATGQQHQQMLQQLLIQRHQHRAPVVSPREQPRKGSAPEVTRGFSVILWILPPVATVFFLHPNSRLLLTQGLPSVL